MVGFLGATLSPVDIIEGETRHADGSRLLHVRRYAGRVPLWAIDLYIPPGARLDYYRSRASNIALLKCNPSVIARAGGFSK